MAQTGPQSPAEEQAQRSATAEDRDFSRLRNLPPALREQFEALGLNRTLSQLIESEQRFRDLFEQGPVAYHELDDEGIVRLVNRAECELLGVEPGAMLGKPIFEFIAPGAQSESREAFKRKLSGQQTLAPFLREYTRSDGCHLTLRIHDVLVQDHRGVVTGIRSAMVDVTAHKEFIDALREREATLQAVCTSAVDALVMIDGEGRAVLWNPAAERMFGYTAAEMLGQPIHDLLAPNDLRQRFLANFPAFQKTGQGAAIGKVVELTARRKDGSEFPIDLSMATVKKGQEWHAVGVVRDITERKKAEDELRTKEALLSESQHIAQLGSWELTEQAGTSVLVWTPETYRIFGVSPDTFVLTAETFVGLIHPDDRAAMQAWIGACLAGLGPPDLEYRFSLQDGSVRYINGRGHIVQQDAEKKLVRVVGVVQDITKRKLAEDELRTKEALLSESQRIAQLGSWDWTVQAGTSVMVWTPETYRLFGVSPDTFVLSSETFQTLIHPDDQASMQAWMSACLAGLGPPDLEFRVIQPDGSVRYINGRGHMVQQDAEKKSMRMVGVAQDITERKRAEDELRTQEGLLSESQHIAHLGSMDWTVQAGTSVMVWTPETYRIFGVSPDTFVPSSETLQTLIHPDDRAPMQAWLSACLAGLRPPDLEFRVIQPDGSARYINGRVHIVQQDAEKKSIRMIGVAQDITERKLAVAALLQRTEELARSNTELVQFAYVASHDLQEPLRMVSSYVQLLARRYSGKLDSDADEFIAFAVDGAKRMQNMINDLLAFSRVTTKGHEFKPVEADTALKLALANLKVAIEESQASVTFDPLPVVNADSAQLTQLFQNLIGNAIKFRRKEPPQVHVSVEKRAKDWEFSVRDNGIGIEPQHLERIFVIFQRLHTAAQFPGTGIGLAICKKIAERHGGNLWVSSQPGVGSTFHFTIPIKGL
jgi:PAS domain S-box-containing protein